MAPAMLETIYPQNETLKKYIRYIYKFSTDDPGFKRNLVIFPNVGSAINIYKNIHFVSTADQEFLSTEKEGMSGVMLHLNRADPVFIKEEGSQMRIVIVLGPLGINQFTTQSPGKLVREHNPTLIPANNLFAELAEFAKGPGMALPLHDSATVIEELLLRKFKFFTHPILENALAEIGTTDERRKIDEIAGSIGASPKTLDRLFLKYIGLSPVTFRKITQFRNALKARLINTDTSFTQIAWDNHYYDLPYMMKVFREMTGMNMNEFFKKISYSHDMQYVFAG